MIAPLAALLSPFFFFSSDATVPCPDEAVPFEGEGSDATVPDEPVDGVDGVDGSLVVTGGVFPFFGVL